MKRLLVLVPLFAAAFIGQWIGLYQVIKATWLEAEKTRASPSETHPRFEFLMFPRPGTAVYADRKLKIKTGIKLTSPEFMSKESLDEGAVVVDRSGGRVAAIPPWLMDALIASGDRTADEIGYLDPRDLAYLPEGGSGPVAGHPGWRVESEGAGVGKVTIYFRDDKHGREEWYSYRVRDGKLLSTESSKFTWAHLLGFLLLSGTANLLLTAAEALYLRFKRRGSGREAAVGG